VVATVQEFGEELAIAMLPPLHTPFGAHSDEVGRGFRAKAAAFSD
jgi:hypothetical protein